MNKEEFHKQLVERYVNNGATEEELEARFHLMKAGEIDEALKSYLDKEADEVMQQTEASRRRHFAWLAIAASLLIFLGTGAYFILHKKAPAEQTQIAKIVPGTNKAILTLANGKQIILTEAKNGIIASENTYSVQKESGKISYTVSSSNITN